MGITYNVMKKSKGNKSKVQEYQKCIKSGISEKGAKSTIYNLQAVTHKWQMSSGNVGMCQGKSAKVQKCKSAKQTAQEVHVRPESWGCFRKNAAGCLSSTNLCNYIYCLYAFLHVSNVAFCLCVGLGSDSIQSDRRIESWPLILGKNRHVWQSTVGHDGLL